MLSRISARAQIVIAFVFPGLNRCTIGHSCDNSLTTGSPLLAATVITAPVNWLNKNAGCTNVLKIKFSKLGSNSWNWSNGMHLGIRYIDVRVGLLLLALPFFHFGWATGIMTRIIIIMLEIILIITIVLEIILIITIMILYNELALDLVQLVTLAMIRSEFCESVKNYLFL